MAGPSAAERARTAVACARTAALWTSAAHPPSLTQVGFDGAQGEPGFRVLASCAAAADLRRAPGVRLRVTPPDGDPTEVQGDASCVRQERGWLTYAVRPRRVLVGLERERVPVEEFARAEPDPLRGDAPAVLAGLRASHGASLARCLRAQGVAGARWVEAQSLDRYGLAVLVLADEGVARARLDFPRPVRSLSELGVGLQALLRSTCRGCDPGRPCDGS